MWLRLSVILFAVLAVPAWSAAAPTALAFESGGFWLVNPATDAFALRAAGLDKARLTLYRLTDPELLTQVVTARAARSLGEGELLRRVAEKADLYWQADFALDAAAKNSMIPVPADIAAGPLPSGIYVLTATAQDDSSTIRVAQWFMRSPLDLRVEFFGDQALIILFDSITRQPRANTMISWLDAQGKILAQQQTDDHGAVYMPQPENAVVVIAGNAEDEVHKADLALTDVPARQAPLNKGLILPSVSRYLPDQDFTILFAAPGLPADASPTAQLGKQPLTLQQLAPGLWQAAVRVPLDKATGALDLVFKNGDQLIAKQSLPQAANSGLALNWQQKPAMLVGTQKLTYRFRLLNKGKPVAAENVTLQVQAVTGDSVDAKKLLGSDVVSFAAKAVGKDDMVADIEAGKLPRPVNSTGSTAQTYYRVTLMVQGQTVGESFSLTAYPATSWLDIRPDFADNAVAEGSAAQFIVHLRTSKDVAQVVPLKWELARETYKFEWYQADDGRWTYRTKTDLAKVLDGATDGKNAVIAAPVGAGRYRLTVRDNNDHSASFAFTAGWWLAALPPQTPEKIILKAQMEQGDAGDRLAVFVDPPFAARVWLAVIDPLNGRAAPLTVQDLGDEGGFVYIPKTALPLVQPLRLTAFAIPAEPGTGMVRAEGRLTMPLDATVKLAPTMLQGNKDNPVTLERWQQGSRSLIELYDTRTNDVLYRSPLQETGSVTLPALAIDAPVSARLLVSDNDMLSISQQPLENASDVTFDMPTAQTFKAGQAASLLVSLKSSVAIKDKLRLVAVAPPEMNLSAATVAAGPLVAKKVQDVALNFGTIKPGAAKSGIVTIRLETRSGEIIAARPLMVTIN